MRTLLVFLSLLFLTDCGSAVAEERKWAFSLFHATLAQERLLEIFTNQHFFEASYQVAATAAKEFAGSRKKLAWEAEGQLVKHYGRQHHWEVNAVLVARWHPFPWDHLLDTSIAIGDGLSFATSTPAVEVEDDEKTSLLLNYLLFELTLGLPQFPRWHASARIHHRSGIFGLFGGIRGGSNFIGLGTTYRY